MNNSNNKSHVSMGFEICPVCHQHHTETVLLHKQLKQMLEPRILTGYSLCPEHQKQKEEGYIFLVEISNQHTTDLIKFESSKPTGKYAAIRKTVWDQLFNVPLPNQDFCFISTDTFSMIQEKFQTQDSQVSDDESIPDPQSTTLH